MPQNNNPILPQITRKTLLYQSGVEYAGYALNHAEGCSHGCHFPCYAMMLKKRCGKVKDYDDWRQPKIVANALELLEKEIPKLKHKMSGQEVSTTHPEKRRDEGSLIIRSFIR